MAKLFVSKKWKRRAMAGLVVALSATLSLGILAACADDSNSGDDSGSTNTPASKTDNQLIRNGNFEFYSEKNFEFEDKRAFINAPTSGSWSFSSGTPSSDTRSGIIDVTEYDYLSKEGKTFSSVADAVAHWEDEDVTLYDRLKFYEDFDEEIDDLAADSKEAKLFRDFSYSIDYEDVADLRADLGDSIRLHDDEAQRENGDTSVLMIHNKRTSDNVRGTGQYYTSGTTVTLSAGTSAKVSVWVRTDKLFHYNADETEVARRAGAYVGVRNTVGGTDLSQMQIKNINTKGDWQQYTVYIRANTFATTTFRIVLGLGQGNSEDRFEHVDGYAFFDDLQCTVIPNAEYERATAGFGDNNACSIDSKAEQKIFDATDNPVANRTYALDLYAGDNDSQSAVDLTGAQIALTEEVAGSNRYTTASYAPVSIPDNRGTGREDSVADTMTLSQLEGKAAQNGYLKNIYSNDFAQFPFSNKEMVMLFSSNGAAYTAKLSEVSLPAGERMLVSFFVKTSEIQTGRSGAGVTLVDGENRSRISPFDSTKIAKVDIDNNTAEGEQFNRDDIYNGWVQCFFFVTNDTETDRTFHLELSYGPTTIAGTTKNDYGMGYAAFANFETRSLTRAQTSYATTGERAVSVSLSGLLSDTTQFAAASATTDIKEGLARPAAYTGVSGGSRNVVESGAPSALPAGVYTGLLNSQYAEAYRDGTKAWNDYLNTLAGGAQTDAEWWSAIFGSATGARVARQPLTIMNASNAATASYGFFADESTLSVNSYQRISMRVKASVGTSAYIYLTDTSDAKTGFATRLSPNIPNVTYWYDDNGDICAKDPADKEFNSKTDILYYLEANGLYTKAGETNGTYYANLHNYAEEDGNLVTKDGTVAFYGKDGTYYAYYNEETDAYTVPVQNLPLDIARYNYTGATMPESVIRVDGTGEWVDVAFYLHSGSEAKHYRLEVWAGERTNATDGLPAGGYVFFDNFSSASISNYSDLLNSAVNKLKKDSANLADPDDRTGNLNENLAKYYTFTFYDSTSYLRYDESEDTESVGNPYGSYKQSGYAEQLVSLLYTDNGEETGYATQAFFLDYAATEVSVPKDDTGNTGGDDGGDDSEEGDGNVWLLASSIALAAVLVFAIVAVFVRRALKNRSKTAKVKPAKKNRAKIKKAEEEEESEPEPEETDDDNPYND